MLAKLTLTLALVATAGVANAISLGSIDDFGADSEGWTVGGAGTPPTQVGDPSFDGQPGFLRHFSDGGGPNGKWLTWSEQADWTGDYLAAGVSALSLWADGRTGEDVPLWVAFDGPGGWFVSASQTIATADDWERYEFDLTEAGLTHVAASGGTGVYADTLGDVTRFELLAGPGPIDYAIRGDLLRAGNSTHVIWLDNLKAIPEPATAALATLLLATTLSARRARA